MNFKVTSRKDKISGGKKVTINAVKDDGSRHDKTVIVRGSDAQVRGAVLMNLRNMSQKAKSVDWPVHKGMKI